MASFLGRWVALFSFVYPRTLEGMPDGTSARPRQGAHEAPRKPPHHSGAALPAE